MENTMPRMLIETTVRQTLKGLQQDPKRSVRNLVDMALQFAQGRFQSCFFETAHTMLQDQHSAYYALIQDAAAHIETEHLVRFGMNLGYNSCTWGARRIRTNEAQLGFNIPWTVLLEVECPLWGAGLDRYHAILAEGEGLGIYTWMLFPRQGAPSDLLPLLRAHPDSAFFLFCPPGGVDDGLVQAASALCNWMPVVRLDAAAPAACRLLRRARLPYSVWLPYGAPQASAVGSGTLFRKVQDLHPIFTALVPRPDCPAPTQAAVTAAVTQARDRQRYATVPWELYSDTRRLDQIISDDACWAFFDKRGELSVPGGQSMGAKGLFRDGLAAVLRQAYPKGKVPSPC